MINMQRLCRAGREDTKSEVPSWVDAQPEALGLGALQCSTPRAVRHVLQPWSRALAVCPAEHNPSSDNAWLPHCYAAQ